MGTNISNNISDIVVARHKNKKIRSLSRSGGAFTAISDVILEKYKGFVFGCVLDENLEAIHICAETIEQRDRMRGSKYVQSDMKDSYADVSKLLKNNKVVLFSGTPCQVAGLVNYLNFTNVNTDKLYTLDIICHGVPSPRIIKDYIHYWENRIGKKCTGIDFRNKKWGWDTHIETLRFGRYSFSSNIYASLFYDDCILRPVCYNCKFKNIHHKSDFTIADAWGIKTAEPEFYDNKGASLVFINTEKASRLFKTASDDLDVIGVKDIRDYWQETFEKSVDYPKSREEFWEYYNTHDLKEVYEKYSTLKSLFKLRFFLIPKHCFKIKLDITTRKVKDILWK